MYISMCSYRFIGGRWLPNPLNIANGHCCLFVVSLLSLCCLLVVSCLSLCCLFVVAVAAAAAAGGGGGGGVENRLPNANGKANIWHVVKPWDTCSEKAVQG